MRTYGSKAHRVGKENLPEIPCSYCHQKGTVELYFFYRYYHFFGIPFFPHRRGGAMMCTNCKQVTNVKLFPADLKEIYLKEKQKYKAPLWQYFGTVSLSFLIIAFAGVQLYKHRTISSGTFLESIKPGRIFKYSITKNRYTFWKITRVNNDSIFYLPSNYEFSGTPPKELDFSENGFFDSTQNLYFRNEIKADFEAKKIRKYKN
ncbi:MAG: hypothetical protein ACM3H8_13600 [Sphingobacteriales bacterium]